MLFHYINSILMKSFFKPRLIAPVFIMLMLPVIMLAPAFALAEPADDLSITGDGVSNPITFTLPELKAMEQCEHVYSTINTWPTKRWYTARGVKLRELLTRAGIKDEATLVRFISSDGYDVTLTVKELLKDKRYYYPGLKDNDPNDGSIPGSLENAEEVEPILALVSAEGTDKPSAMNDRDALLFILGQRAVTEQTNNLFLKYVNQIEVLTTIPDKWDNPRANIPSGTTVPVGTMIEMKNKHNNEDKIYYTTDGSTPTIDSPMFNWSASRWWDQRDDVKGINKTIPVEKDTIIKMITIGPGKEDSEVVTFKFTADMTGKAVDPTKIPGGPVTGVTLDHDKVNRPIGSTIQLDATIEPFNATDQDVIWSSSDTRVATVDNHGLVTVVGPGSAVITVTTIVGNHTASCIINGPEGEANNQDLPAVTGSQDNNSLEPPAEPTPNTDTTKPVSSRANQVPASASVPQERASYLARKDDLDHGSSPDEALAQYEVWQVFETSADTIPLPLQEVQDRMKVYAGILFIMLLLSGAGNKYTQYAKER